MNSTDLQFLKEFVNRFDKLFDLIRVVDPVKKQIVQYQNLSFEVLTSICYDYWKNDAHCANCVSYRAMKENDTFVKIEYNKEKIYMVTASPITLSNQTYVVEMLKDISETGIIPDLKGKTIEEINDIIDKLNKEVITDPLTDLFNRRYLNERLPVDLYDAFNNHTKLSFIMLDIDYFKIINDTYGHTAGDVILQELGTIIKNCIRKNVDWAARYGGEEFFVSLIGADSLSAYTVAEKIRKTVETKKFDFSGNAVSITVSAGCYTLGDHELTIEELLGYVDQNLYRAKQNGRNMVVANCQKSNTAI